MINFLDIAEERQKVDFPYDRESLKTAGGLDTRKDAILRTDTNRVLGVVSRTHDLLSYGQIMDFMTKTFDELKLPIKLIESHLLGGGRILHQEYLMDGFSIDTPDGSEMSPMAIVHAGYDGSYGFISFGTYRHICLNGACIGNTISKILLKYSSSLLGSSVLDDIIMSTEKFMEVAEKYNEIGKEDFEKYFWKILPSSELNFTFKKEMLNELQSKNVIEFKEANFANGDLEEKPQDIFDIKNQMSAWDFYNVLTAVATHKMRTATARISSYNQIAKVYDI